MLILTRRIGESITVGDEIRIQVIDIQGKQVRLGIEAPAGLQVHRREIYEKILKENLEAAKIGVDSLEKIMKPKGGYSLEG